MAIFTKDDIEKLAAVESELCLSIFIPTHRGGGEVINGKDALELKNKLKEAEGLLTKVNGFDEKSAREFLKPVKDLVDDAAFWRHQSEGLAIFLSKGFFKHYSLPISPKSRVHVGKNFLLKPLVPIVSSNGRFFLLALSRGEIKLYDCTRFTISTVAIADLVPKNLQDELRYDDPETHLQFRTGQSQMRSGKDIGGGTIYHGHGGGKDDSDEELRNYCKHINKGLTEVLKKEKFPLLLAGPEDLTGIYKGINDYPNMVKETLQRNPFDIREEELLKMAWEKVEPVFSGEEQRLIQECVDLQHSNKASGDIAEIIPASINGRVSKLVLNEDAEVWGKYSADDNSATLNGSRMKDNELLNEALIHTLRNGGDVYIVERNRLPKNNATATALLRY